MNVYKRDLTVTVASNTGEVYTSAYPGGPVHGLMTMVGVQPPAAESTYDLAIYDEAGFILYGEENLTGDTTISLEKLCNSALRVVLSNASDGSYAVRLYVRG